MGGERSTIGVGTTQDQGETERASKAITSSVSHTPFPCTLYSHPLPAARTRHHTAPHHTTHMSLGIAHPFVVGVLEIERVVAMCRDQRCQSEEGDRPAHGAVRESWLGMEDGANDER
jgi:hypothetical protein